LNNHKTTVLENKEKFIFIGIIVLFLLIRLQHNTFDIILGIIKLNKQYGFNFF